MRYLFIGFISVLFSSCTPFLDQPNIEYQLGGGAFVVNEGNFLGGNSSLSFFSYDSLEVFNDLFSSNNSRPLGDVANSMVNFGDNGYIVVNNSGKIEVIDQKSFKSKATISGLVSPRNMAILNESKAYVTSMYSDSIAILNLYSNTISGYINLGKTSEAIVVNGSTAYVSNWLGGNKVFVINTMLDKVIDSITVGLEPESLVLDRYYRLWALCTGGWQKTQKAELDLINTGSDRIE
ncbi:MAG: YncE family protein, partial [Chloroflexota bacterium]